MRAFTLLGAVLLGACATAPREPWVLTTDGLPEFRARDLEEISTYPRALATLGSFPDRVEQSRGEAGLILYDYA